METFLSDVTTFATETVFTNKTVISNSLDPSTPVDLFDGYSTALLHFAAVCCILFIVLGVPGNLITIIALARCKKVRNATAVFIINLSLSDLLNCCFNLPLAASTFLNRAWTHGDLLCRLFPLLRYGLLAVSLFTILAITINRYVMIGHPRIYPRVYQRKLLIVMVATCWIFAFLPLVFTWTGQWGQFGLDTQIGSCSILPDKKGHSPKEFLFLIAFLLPCLCILICYARIFYIVRKTHESVIKSAGSVKIIQPSVSNASGADGKKLSNDGGSGGSNFYIHNGTHEQLLPAGKRYHQQQKQQQQQPIDREQYSETSSSDDTSKHRINRCGGVDDNCSSSRAESVSDKCSVQTAVSSRTSSLYQRQRRYLTKLNDEELKFIDTSVESDLPPTLSNLRTSIPVRGNKVQTQLSVTINEHDDTTKRQHRTNNNNNIEDSNDFDSAVEHSSSSMEQNQTEKGDEGNNSTQHLTIPIDMDPSSSSGIDIPPEPENRFQRSKKRSFVSTLRKNTTRLTTRNRSMANTSGASIMYPGRMTPKDRRLLKMILVIFVSFVICYLPITINKIFESVARNHFMNISGYVLIYLTTCINPIIYVVMSSEYRQAYKNLLMCRNSNMKPSRKETHRAASPKE